MMTHSDLQRHLPTQLRRLAWMLEQGEVPARYVDRLAGEVGFALRRVERDKALRDLAALMPSSSRWETAGALVDALKRFRATAWPRVRSGARPPRGELERICAEVLEHGEPPCQRIIWESLRHPGAILESIARAPATATG